MLVGPSGCGKTTTLNMIAGLETISSGQLLIGDNDVTDLPPKARDIAMVFQSYALFPHLTVFENIAFGLKIRRVARGDIDTQVRGVADRLRIEVASRPSAEGAFGRPASARGACPRACPAPGRLPDGRAAVEPRREAAHRGAEFPRQDASGGRRDDGLCHPRPVGSDDHGRHDRGDEGRRGSTGRFAARGL